MIYIFQSLLDLILHGDENFQNQLANEEFDFLLLQSLPLILHFLLLIIVFHFLDLVRYFLLRFLYIFNSELLQLHSFVFYVFLLDLDLFQSSIVTSLKLYIVLFLIIVESILIHMERGGKAYPTLNNISTSTLFDTDLLRPLINHLPKISLRLITREYSILVGPSTAIDPSCSSPIE